MSSTDHGLGWKPASRSSTGWSDAWPSMYAFSPCAYQPSHSRAGGDSSFAWRSALRRRPTVRISRSLARPRSPMASATRPSASAR